jgi:hypothetical protein
LRVKERGNTNLLLDFLWLRAWKLSGCVGLSLDSSHVYDWQGLGDVVGMTKGGTDDGIEDLILEIGKEMERWYLVAGVL